jgi:Domain of unknown function (DUF4129)
MMRRLLSGWVWPGIVTLLALVPACGQSPPGVAAAAVESRTAASVQDYRRHLEALDALVGKCRKERTAQACDSSAVGADDKVWWPSGGAAEEREISYDWLRSLLDRARQKNESQPAKAPGVQVIKTKPETTDELLGQAQQRLESDWRQAGAPATPETDYTAERRSLTAILARREYRGTSETSAKERFQEWLENVLANFFERLAKYGSHSPWIGYLLEGLLVGALATALIWALIRLERRSRVRLTPELSRAFSAPSAREWHLWLEDAQKMAGTGRWRDAIHFLYWASIARLESMRVWPADRARTPREYLGLIPGADPRKANLTALTRTFERTWYGGREAYSADFQAALKLAATLGVE